MIGSIVALNGFVKGHDFSRAEMIESNRGL
jgi:hypothetical protein